MKSVPTVLNDIRPESDFSVSKDFITRAAPSTSGRAKKKIYQFVHAGMTGGC